MIKCNESAFSAAEEAWLQPPDDEEEVAEFDWDEWRFYNSPD